MTPKSLGYYFPAEFAPHQATWLSWPHKEASWPGKIDAIFPSYVAFIKTLSRHEQVNINVVDEVMKQRAFQLIEAAGVDMGKINFFIHPTNDAWCRDHGPAFLLNKLDPNKKAIVDWSYNAWGNKYPPFDLDDVIPTLIGNQIGLPVFNPGIIMEGATACLLNPNRNPHLSKSEIEQYLMDYYGQDQVLWVDEGIVGDDTDGHIDDTVRFVNEDTVITVIEENKSDDNYALLQHNLKQLQAMRLLNGKQLNIVELPMPDPVIWEEQMLPASYANFYIANQQVVVPTFRSDKDNKALEIIQGCFPDREIVGIDSTDIIWGLGSFHCLSQQEPGNI
ncbi:MAG: agmatine deiminase family protein [Chitinophagaceae bacterium]|nr:agmatine deiminase family protein [Chitinophagaceae bacterium]